MNQLLRLCIPQSIAAFVQAALAESGDSGNSSAPSASTATPRLVFEETYR